MPQIEAADQKLHVSKLCGPHLERVPHNIYFVAFAAFL